MPSPRTGERSPRAACGRKSEGSFSAAVKNCKDQRKPAAVFGHRKVDRWREAPDEVPAKQHVSFPCKKTDGRIRIIAMARIRPTFLLLRARFAGRIVMRPYSGTGNAQGLPPPLLPRLPQTTKKEGAVSKCGKAEKVGAAISRPAALV